MTESTYGRDHVAESREKIRTGGKETVRRKTLRGKTVAPDKENTVDHEEDTVDRMVRVINTAAKEGTMFKKMRENEEVIIYMSKDRNYVIKELPGGKILRRKAEDGSPWEPYDGPPHQGCPEIFPDWAPKSTEEKI